MSCNLLAGKPLALFTQERTVPVWENKSFYDGKLSANLGAREICTNQFLSCNFLTGKPFALFTLERIISIIKSKNKSTYDRKL